MTNKIHLSFNRLYTLKDGDYHGATLTYRIKHGDDLLAEGEVKGKSLSQFIRPIDIEETEITKPLSVEYVCTGNVEAVSAFPAMSDPGFRICKGGQVFINSAVISPVIITNAHLKLAEDAHLIGGKSPKIGDHLPDAKRREKVREIVGRYLTGEASEYSEEMIDELMSVVVPAIPSDVHTGGTLSDCKTRFAGERPVGELPFGGFPSAKVSYSAGINIGVQVGDSDHREMKSPDELTEKVEAIIREQLKPGGILWRN